MMLGRPAVMMPMLAGALLLAATAVAGTPAPPPAPPPPAGDAAAGKTVSAKCMACHSFVAGQNKMGPSLAGVVGRKSGSVANFTYSPAMKASNLTWDPGTLDRYLTSPRAVVPGTKMIFGGIPAPADRANLIAYLASTGATKP